MVRVGSSATSPLPSKSSDQHSALSRQSRSKTKIGSHKDTKTQRKDDQLEAKSRIKNTTPRFSRRHVTERDGTQTSPPRPLSCEERGRNDRCRVPVIDRTSDRQEIATRHVCQPSPSTRHRSPFLSGRGLGGRSAGRGEGRRKRLSAPCGFISCRRHYGKNNPARTSSTVSPLTSHRFQVFILPFSSFLTLRCHPE